MSKPTIFSEARRILDGEPLTEAAFMRLPGHVIGNELWRANEALKSFTASQLNGNDFNAKNFNEIIAMLTKIKGEAKGFADGEDVPVSYQYKKK